MCRGLRRWSGLGRREDRSLPFRQRRDRDERGAVAVLTAFILVILMAISALVVDLGLQRVTRADLQALADVVALDLGREITGSRTQAELAPEGDWANPASAVRESAARNTDDLLGDNLDIQVDWGSYENEQWDTAPDPPSAVKVVVRADTDYAISDGTGDVERTAYAVAWNSACYKLGSFLAAVNSGDSTVLGPLNDLFGVNLTLVGYQALAGADVTLSELAATSAIGSPNQLLTGTVTFSNLVQAMIEVLSNKPGANNAAAVSALGTILGASGAIGAITLGNVLHVSPTDQAALDMSLNVLDIVGSAALSNGDHFIAVPNLNATVPGVGSQFTGGLTLISAAQLACGRPNSPDSVANNAQLEGSLGIEFVNLPSLSIPGFATLLTEKGTGTLDVTIADGTGHLISPPEVQCGQGTAANPTRYSVAVTTTPASYALSSNLTITGEVKTTDLVGIGLTNLLTSLGLPILGTGKVQIRVEVNLTVATASAGGTTVADLTIPPNDVTPFQTGTTVTLDPSNVVPRIDAVVIGGSNVAVGGALSLTNLIVNELVAANNGFVQKTLYPLIDGINNDFIGPVARMVGLRFGGADVYAVGAVCGQPSLWG